MSTTLARLTAVALLAGGLTALPATAAAPSPCVDAQTGALQLQQQQTWMHQATTKAGNLAAVGADAFPTWDTTKPTASVRGGAGGGYAGTFAAEFAGQDEALAGATFVGGFDGCLDTMLLDLYAFLPTNRTGTSGSLTEAPLVVWTTLEVDGQEIAAGQEVETRTVVNEAGTGGTSYRSRLALTGLHRALVAFGIDPSADHDVRLTVTPRFANTNNAVFVYDTVEVPAGIGFNGTPDATYAELPLG